MTETNKIEWKEVELGEICLVDSGQGAPQGENYFSNGSNVFVRAGDLNNLTEDIYVGDYCEKITDEAIREYKLKLYKKNSIVFPKSGMSIQTGNIAILKHDSYVVNHLAIIGPSNKINNLFLFYLLKKKGISHLSQDASYPSIRLSNIKNLKIPLPFSNDKPDLKEQERIVSILERAERLKERGKNAEDLLDEYLKSVFNEMFYKGKFEKTKLKDMCQIITKGTTPTTYGYAFVNHGINFFKIENIDEGGNIIMDSINYISPEAHASLKRSQLSPGDILFSIAGALGRIAIVKKEHLPANINQAIAIIRLKLEKEINKKYLEFHLRSDSIIKQITENKRGVAQLNLNLEQVGNLGIIIPPLPLQQKFAKIVEQVEKMKENVKKTKQNSEELFNSLMSKAFRGEL